MTTTTMSTLAEVLGWMADTQRDRVPASQPYVNMGDFVRQHGLPFQGRKLPKGYRYGPQKQCFRNAYYLARKHRELTYVEGYVMSIIPIQHAWCVDADGQVVDNTLRRRPDETLEYLGVPMPLELVDRAILLSGKFGVLDDWSNNYPILQQPYDVEAAMRRYRELTKEKGTFR